MIGISAGDTIKVKYRTQTSFPSWAHQVQGDTFTFSITVVDQTYAYCQDVISMAIPEVQLTPGAIHTLDLVEIYASDDCGFSLQMEIVTATPAGIQMPTITLTEPTFSFKEAPSEAKDYPKMTMDTHASL